MPAVTVMPATKTMIPITRIMPIPASVIEPQRAVRWSTSPHPLFRSRTETVACFDVDAAADDRVVVHLQPDERRGLGLTVLPALSS